MPVQAHLEEGALYDLEVRMCHKDSTYVWVRIPD
jgi:hypothetical protein